MARSIYSNNTKRTRLETVDDAEFLNNPFTGSK